MFGGSLAVDHARGVAVVGAPGASLTGLWQEVCLTMSLGKADGNLSRCGGWVLSQATNADVDHIRTPSYYFTAE